MLEQCPTSSRRITLVELIAVIVILGVLPAVTEGDGLPSGVTIEGSELEAARGSRSGLTLVTVAEPAALTEIDAGGDWS